MIDSVHLAGFGGNNGVIRSWSRGQYTTVNQYFGNGNIVTLDPTPTDAGGHLNANTTILSLGDAATRNTQIAALYGGSVILKARNCYDGPTWTSWVTLLHTGNYTGTLDGRYVKKAGDSMTGNLSSNSRFVTSYASGTWINSVSNAALTVNHSNYGGVWCAPTKSGRVAMSTYPASDDYVYLGYASAAQISAGTNSFNRSTYWEATTGIWTADGYAKKSSSDAYVLLGGGGHKALSTMQSEYDARYVNVTGDTMSGGLTLSSGYVTLVNGWFQNNSSGGGLYNSNQDARWYANGGWWIADKPIQGHYFKSVIGTGTAPYQCSSTTLNTNLNADLLDSWHASGTSGACLVKYGYTVNGTSAAWSRLAKYSISTSETLSNVGFLLYSSFNDRWGILHIRTRGKEYVYGELMASYNIDLNKIRIYYSSDKTGIELYYYAGESYSVMGAKLLYSTGRVGNWDNNVTMYHANTTAPSWSTYVTPTISSLQNNVSSATMLQTARTINGTSFNGTANITTSYWGTARTINGTSINGSTNYVTSYWGTTRSFYLRDHNSGHTGAVTNVNGSTTYYLYLPSTINASLSGNATTATTLQTARTINGTSFNGSANIVTSYWGTSRNFYIQDAWGNYTGAAISVNGSGNPYLKLPSTIRADSFAIPNRGSCYFKVGGGDNANEVGSTTTSNIEINSWYGVTFTTTCTGQTYTNKVAMSVNCRTGRVTANNFHAATNVTANGAITAKASSSDIRLKRDIKDFSAMEILRKIQPKQFYWNEIAKANSPALNNDNRQYGLIAQNIQNMPELEGFVDNVFKDYLIIHYEKFIPIALEGLKEVDDEVTKLKRRVEVLEKENEVLKRRIPA